MSTEPEGAGMPPDLHDEAVRRRLGPSGWKAVRRIMRIWQVPDATSRRLLGFGPAEDMDMVDPKRLGEEQMLRISYLLAIYKGLHIYWGKAIADKWIQCPNMSAMFGGRSPLAFMADGGIDALRDVRRLLDAWCVGN